MAKKDLEVSRIMDKVIKDLSAVSGYLAGHIGDDSIPMLRLAGVQEKTHKIVALAREIDNIRVQYL